MHEVALSCCSNEFCSLKKKKQGAYDCVTGGRFMRGLGCTSTAELPR